MSDKSELDAVRAALRKMRLHQKLSYRESAEICGTNVPGYCRLEMGKPDTVIEKDMSCEIDARCHRCWKTFRTNPIKGVVFPHYVCPECQSKPEDESD